MRAAIVALVTAVALVTSVMAQTSPKILVLPLGGDAPAEQRTALDQSVATLARTKLGGDVTVGDTTFEETAAAVGCDAQQPACAETVRTTLQVDELVYGTANTADGSTTVIVMRASGGSEPTSQIVVIGETDTGAQAEERLAPLFTPVQPTGEGSALVGSDQLGSDALGSGSAAPPPAEEPPSHFFDTRERKLGVAIGGGGVLLMLIGFSLWASSSSLQDDIDDHPTRTLDDVTDLLALEDRASSRAMQGNVLVVLGLAAAGVGGYFLWKDRENRRSATVTPAPVSDGTGVSLVLRGRW